MKAQLFVHIAASIECVCLCLCFTVLHSYERNVVTSFCVLCVLRWKMGNGTRVLRKQIKNEISCKTIMSINSLTRFVSIQNVENHVFNAKAINSNGDSL